MGIVFTFWVGGHFSIQSRYFAETLLVPLARGRSPFARKELRRVNPMDFPCLYRLRKYRFRAVGR